MTANTHKPELLKQNDIVSFYHIQMPHWLFADKRYNHISLPAKVAYALLLNRFQLSKLHGWKNGYDEIYIIYPREELAGTLQVGAHKAIAIFKELTDAGLVWEVRRGNNKANHIYLTRVELSDEDSADYGNAPFLSQMVGDDETGYAETACPNPDEGGDITEDTGFTQYPDDSGYAENAHPELPEPLDVQKQHVRDCQNSISGGAENASPEVRIPHPSHTYYSQNEHSHIEKSQSVGLARARESPDRRTDDELEELEEIIERCDLWTFERDTAKVFENAIERLFFSKSFQIGNCVLPQQKVRSHLHELDQIKLQTAEQKIARNTATEIRNTTAYSMAVIFNSIWETTSDIMNDPYLNSMRAPPVPDEQR